MKTSNAPGVFSAGQAFIGARASDMEARAKKKDKRYQQYADKFAYFFRKDFLVKRLFEVLNAEGKPEFVGFKRNCDVVWPRFR